MLMMRPACATDVPVLLEMVRELAIHEGDEASVVATEEDLRRDGFGLRPRFQVLLAEWEGRTAGFALYFFGYSPRQGKAVLHVEDLYIRPAYQRRGISRAMLNQLARVAVSEGCHRYECRVLETNASGIAFYRALGARFPHEGEPVRIEGEELRRLATPAEAAST